jgi:hypothetical protein
VSVRGVCVSKNELGVSVRVLQEYVYIHEGVLVIEKYVHPSFFVNTHRFNRLAQLEVQLRAAEYGESLRVYNDGL